jgi:hypothetical protein
MTLGYGYANTFQSWNAEETVKIMNQELGSA